jgi:hypothetical protein
MVSETKFTLSKSQIDKLNAGFKHHLDVTLKLSALLINPSGHIIPLTDKERDLLRDNKNHNIKIPYSRLKDLDIKHGGIFPLIPVIGAILAGIAAAGGTAASVASTVKSAKDIANEKRKTDAIIENDKRKADALIAATKGEGFFLKSGKQSGNGFFLKSGKQSGNGFFLKAGKQSGKGEGFFLKAGKGYGCRGRGFFLQAGRGRGFFLKAGKGDIGNGMFL